MRALFDVNVLLALFDQDHVHHRSAAAWRRAHAGAGWASCPLTQNGFVRVVSQRSYPRPISAADAVRGLSAQIELGDHEFWADDVSILDRSIFDHSRILGPRQLTDVYLLALATRHGGRLVTLDKRVSPTSVHGAGAEQLVVIG